MQAVEQHKGTNSNDTIVRVLAAFGAIVMTLIVVAALAYGAIVVAGAISPKTATAPGPALDTSAAVLAFRAGERASLNQSATQLYNQFRQGERGDAAVTAQQLTNQFRAGERGDSVPSAQQLDNQFRAGERGDTTQP
jgi:hypothetical protein